MKSFFRGKEITGGSPGAFIETVDKVNEEEDACGDVWVIHAAIHASTSDMEDEV